MFPSVSRLHWLEHVVLRQSGVVALPRTILCHFALVEGQLQAPGTIPLPCSTQFEALDAIVRFAINRCLTCILPTHLQVERDGTQHPRVLFRVTSIRHQLQGQCHGPLGHSHWPQTIVAWAQHSPRSVALIHFRIAHPALAKWLLHEASRLSFPQSGAGPRFLHWTDWAQKSGPRNYFARKPASLRSLPFPNLPWFSTPPDYVFAPLVTLLSFSEDPPRRQHLHTVSWFPHNEPLTQIPSIDKLATSAGQLAIYHYLLWAFPQLPFCSSILSPKSSSLLVGERPRRQLPRAFPLYQCLWLWASRRYRLRPPNYLSRRRAQLVHPRFECGILQLISPNLRCERLRNLFDFPIPSD